MQIDFHHSATYVIARFSGFSHKHASTIAYAAQYVDDSTTDGFIHFTNGMRYRRYATSHPVIAPDNIDNDANVMTWLPFHFIPGNVTTRSESDLSYFRKLVCRPDSALARRMMQAARADRGRPESLHRLGIAAHVFVDTFAHQGFAGLHHPINKVSDIRDESGAPMRAPLVPPVGHGQVGSYPDLPYLRWSYLNWEGSRIHRDNPADYLLGANRLCEEFQRYRNKPVVGLTASQRRALEHLFTTLTDPSGQARHQRWLQHAENGSFEFGPVKLNYDPSGPNSWKQIALRHGPYWWPGGMSGFGTRAMRWMRLGARSVADSIGIEYASEYASHARFLRSDYKKFHDAALRQRSAVLHDILPEFGIVMA